MNPTTLDDGLLTEIVEIAQRHKDRCDRDKILATSRWTKEQTIDREGTTSPRENMRDADRKAASG